MLLSTPQFLLTLDRPIEVLLPYGFTKQITEVALLVDAPDRLRAAIEFHSTAMKPGSSRRQAE